MSETENEQDSEGDEVPIAQTIRQKTKQSDIWVPTAETKALLTAAEEKAIEDEPRIADVQEISEGQEAVGVGIARDFGKDVGVFRGEVKHVRAQRKRHVYHVKNMKTETVKISTCKSTSLPLKSGKHWTKASLDVMTMRKKTTIG